MRKATTNISIALVITLVLQFCAAGCGVDQTASDSARDRWARQWPEPVGHGTEPEARRAALAMDRLRVQSWVQPAGLHVLANRRPAAFAWPDRHVYVTTGLLALLDDDELTAALAHELGHLQARDRHLAALRGPAADDIETRADELGCELLKAGGIRPAVLARALAKVRDAPDTPVQCREALTHRIEWLRLRDEIQ
ncbi:MAG: hypothetical protein JWO87_581 [Phycisphaerales bacterium]|nr:hypothetical protein [Phycisphaerales bacterium]MDB5302898.1 hypothetical protein [Phycisphaerales bacterium]